MVYFKVGRDDQGNRVMQSKELEPNKPRRRRGVPPHLLEDQVSPALRDIVAGIHENDVDWLREHLERLEEEADIEKVYGLEVAHPKHQGGRKGAIKAIRERREALGFVEPEGEGELKPWKLKIDPAAYIKRYGKDAKNSALAQAHLDRGKQVEKAVADLAEATEGDEEDPFEQVSDAFPCPECDFVAASETGLTGHIEAQHPDAG